MNKPSNEFDYFEVETRLRTIVSDLIAPAINKTLEHEVILKNLQASTKQTDESMKNFENLLSKSIIRMVPNEEFNKRLLEIISDKRSTDTVFHMKLESTGSRVDFMNHQFSDMLSRIKNLEEIQKHIRSAFDDISTTFREFKENFSDKIEKIEFAVLNFSESDSKVLENVEEMIRVERAKITEINQNALPDIVNQAEAQMKILKDLRADISDLQQEKVLPGDLKKLRNHLEYEVKKNKSHADSEVHNLREYLDKMLRVEISCGISDTLLQVLDPRQIKKLIPLAEGQVFPQNEEPRPDPVTTELLHKKTLASSSKLEEKLVQVKRRMTKELEKPLKIQTLKKLEIEAIESPRKHLESGGSTTKREAETKRVENVESEVKVLASPPKVPSPSLSVKVSVNDKYVETVNEQVSDKSSLKTEKSLESFEKISEISLDPVWVQEQINQLAVDIKIAIQTNEEVKSLMRTCVEVMKIKVQEAQQEFSKTIMILNEELKINGKQRIKDLSDIQTFLNENLANINEKIVKLDNNDAKIAKLNEVVLAVIENEKIIFELLAQDEEDRKNIQLQGYSESKSKKTLSKLPISLKAECLSCTGENPLIYSAFKMACLSYNPSDVQYNMKTFTRKTLINTLGELVYNTWNPEFTEKLKSGILNDYSSVRIKSHQRTRTTSRHFLDVTVSKLLSEHVTPQHSRRDIKFLKSKDCKG
jgi:hypothetical protein